MVVAASASTASTADENEVTFTSTTDDVVAEAPSTADDAISTVKSGWQHGNGRRDNGGDEDDILTWPRTGMTWKGGLCRYDNMIAIVSSLGCLLALAKKYASLVAGRLPRWRCLWFLFLDCVFAIGVQIDSQLTTNFIQVGSDCVQYSTAALYRTSICKFAKTSNDRSWSSIYSRHDNVIQQSQVLLLK